MSLPVLSSVNVQKQVLIFVYFLVSTWLIEVEAENVFDLFHPVFLIDLSKYFGSRAICGVWFSKETVW